MTQHITQEQAFEQWYVENAVNLEVNPIWPRDCGLQRKAWHAAIQWDRDQHYLDQHKAELPVLPGPYFGSGRYLGAAGSRDAYTTTQLQAYGQQCAAHARELALSEAKLIAKLCCSADDSAFGDGYNTAAFNIERDIEKLKVGK